MYAGAVATGPVNQVHDFSDALDAFEAPLYFDIIQLMNAVTEPLQSG